MKKRAHLLSIAVLSILTLILSIHDASARTAGDDPPGPLTVSDFFLTEDELPSPWIPEPGVYSPGLHMAVKEKWMGGDWWSERIRDAGMSKSLHVTIGLFPTEAEAIHYADPDTYIFLTDAYQETGRTFTEVLQVPNSQYSLGGGTIYGDGGFSGGYQHLEFQPFNVFRVGPVLFHVEASDPSGEGILEPLLVEKARRLLNTAGPPEDGGATDTPPPPQPPTLTPVQSNPIVLKASLGGADAGQQTASNPNNWETVTISGVVADQNGKGIGGAQVAVVSGADAASTATNPDGSYSFTLSVTGGQGSGAVQGINFTIQASDLTIDRVVLLQAIEGGQLVAGRAVGVRVFLNWPLDPPVDVEVTVTVDGQALPSVQGTAKKDYTQRDRNRGLDAVNIVIPKDQLPSWGDSSHTLTVAVTIVSPGVVDSDPGNNTSPQQNFTLKQTAALSILYVSLDPNIRKPQLVSFAARASSFLDKLYPISYSWGFVGTRRTSYYLVSPYVDFLKSQDADDLPFGLGDIGIIEGGLEVGKSFSYKAAIIAVEKARVLYNSQRCKDAEGKLILPCPDEVALQAVGVYSDGAFGSSKDGFAYAARRLEWRSAANSQAKPDNVAHELGHLFGFGEEYSATTFGVPITGSTWDGVDFKTADGSCINIMGNVGLACAWINAATWNSLIDNSLHLGVPSEQQVAALDPFAPRFIPLAAEIQAPALLVEGVVTSEGAGFLSQVTALERYEQPADSGGEFVLEARDAQGTLLGTARFDGLFFDLDANSVSASPFMVTLPVSAPDQVAEMTLFAPDGQVIDTLTRSAAAPEVRFDALPATVQDQAAISWQAGDADGEPLLSTLYYSRDGGLHWQLLGLDMPVTRFDLEAAELPGGLAVFKVIVSDGFNAAEDVSTAVSMPDQPPILTIIEPWGAEFDSQEVVSIEAVAYDLEDGLMPPDSMQWTDGQGNPLGTGSRLQIDSLPAGANEISVQVQDSAGNSASGSTVIQITETEVPLAGMGNGLYGLWFWLGCLALMVFLGAAGGWVIWLVARRRRRPKVARGAETIQDERGNWWYQDPESGGWSIWNGQVWQPVGANAAAPGRMTAAKPRRGGSCLLSLIAAALIGLVVAGGISLVAFDFFPNYRIVMGAGDPAQILKMLGGGLLAALLGVLMLNSGFKAVLTRRAVVEDDWGSRREKRGCSAVLSGLGQLFFAILLLGGGLGWMTLGVYQEVLPWMGY